MELLTWDQIDKVDYRQRSAAIHIRRLADDAGYRASCAHWDKVRSQIDAGTYEPKYQPLTLAQQADKQIARLERELAEWRKIKEQNQ